MATSAPLKSVTPPPRSLKQTSLINLQTIDRSIYLQLVIVVGIAVLIAAGFYVYLRFEQDRLIRGKATAENTQIAEQDKKLAEIELQSTQDQQRKNDVAMINSALKSFFLKEKKAPDSLTGLVPDYLRKLPTDPVTQKEYGYQSSSDKKSWSVAATLSSGTTFTAKGP